MLYKLSLYRKSVIWIECETLWSITVQSKCILIQRHPGQHILRSMSCGTQTHQKPLLRESSHSTSSFYNEPHCSKISAGLESTWVKFYFLCASRAIAHTVSLSLCIVINRKWVLNCALCVSFFSWLDAASANATVTPTVQDMKLMLQIRKTAVLEQMMDIRIEINQFATHA